MKTVIQSTLLVLLSFSGFAQKKLHGEWKISAQKTLSIHPDQTFRLVKGTFNYEGTWSVKKIKKESDQLILEFTKGTRLYNVERIERNEIRLYDLSKDQILILSRIGAPTFEDDIQEESIASSPDSKSKEEILQELYPRDYFDKGRFVFNPGYGLIDYLDSLPSVLETGTPSVSLLLEQSLGGRFGLGLKLGYRTWTIPESTYEASLYSSAFRLTYHPRLVDKLDTYLGATAVLRFGTLRSADDISGKWSTDYSPVIGARYYLLSRLAITGEYAYDTSSNLTLGMALLIN